MRSTLTGADRVAKSPRPSCPLALTPQVHSLALMSIALEKLSPAAMPAIDDSPFTSNGAAAIAGPRSSTTVLGAEAPKAGFSLFPKRVNTADLALFTRQLASLFNAGLNVARCLDTLIEHSVNLALRAALTQVRQDVQGGSTLWEALGAHPRIFSEL